MDLIEPRSTDELRAALREASERRARVGVVGGRTHLDKGNPSQVDHELSTSRLDRVVAYEPAEMLAVVEAGVPIAELRARLASDGQEWPADAPDDATVGGTIAAGASSARRLRFGALRDSVVEMALVTGDGRLVRSGARTVKNVTGYDVHRLATGSLGTLGAIARIALKLRPLAKARRVLMTDEGGLELGRRLLAAVPLPVAVVAGPERVCVALEGWPAEIEEQTGAARRVTSVSVEDDGVAHGPERVRAPVVAEIAVAPSMLDAALDGEDEWRALIGVGIAWVGLPNDGERLAAIRRRVAEADGIAPVIRGHGGLGDAPVAALEVHRRLKVAFDPAGILAPGRFWGGL